MLLKNLLLVFSVLSILGMIGLIVLNYLNYENLTTYYKYTSPIWVMQLVLLFIKICKE